MRVRRLRGLIYTHIPGGEHSGKWLECFGAARPLLFIDHIWMMPFFQLQNLFHFWKDADTPFIRCCQDLFTCDLSFATYIVCAQGHFFPLRKWPSSPSLNQIGESGETKMPYQP